MRQLKRSTLTLIIRTETAVNKSVNIPFHCIELFSNLILQVSSYTSISVQIPKQKPARHLGLWYVARSAHGKGTGFEVVALQ